jgi:hypothetical protein
MIFRNSEVAIGGALREDEYTLKVADEKKIANFRALASRL